MEDQSEGFTCPSRLCLVKRTSLRDLINHIKRVHENDSEKGFTCVVKECEQFFSSCVTFRRHCSTFHSYIYERSSGGQLAKCDERVSTDSHPCDIQGSSLSGEITFNHGDQNSGTRGSDCVEHSYEFMVQKLRRLMAILSLKLQYKYSLTNESRKSVLSDLNEIVLEFKNSFSSVIAGYLNIHNVKYEDLDFVLTDSHTFQHFVKLSRSEEDTIFKEIGFVAPEELHAESCESSSSRSSIICDETMDVDKDSYMETNDINNEQAASQTSNRHDYRETFQYISILDTLRKYIAHGDVLNAILNEPPPRRGILDGMRSGSFLQSHEFFQKHPNALRLLVYSDEFGVTNSLMSHQKKYKQCAVYFSLNNIPPQHSSTNDSVFLVLLAKYSLVEKHSYKVIFAPLLRDLKILEEQGLLVSYEGRTYHFYGGVAAIVGDNLTIHNLGGFEGNFNSGHVCRRCMATTEDLNRIWCEDDCVLRSDANHKLQVEAIKKDPSLEAVYGVTHESCFSDIESYKPINSLPPDELHNWSYGLIETCLIIVIRGLAKGAGKVFSLDDINERLINFKFGKNDKLNQMYRVPKSVLKPANKASISGTGAEKDHLFRMLSFILGPDVPESNPYWQVYLTVSKILDVLRAPIIHEEWLELTETLVYEHHKMLNSLNDDMVGKFKPKMHYAVHDCRMTKLYGPLILISTRKFERIHFPLKRILQKACNKKNSSKTMAERFQRRRCLDEAERSNALSESILIGTQRTKRISTLPPNERDSVLDFYNKEIVFISQVKSVKLNGLKVSTDDYVIIDIVDEVIVFLHVCRIYVSGGVWCIYGRLVVTDEWNEHLHAFRIKEDVNDDDALVCVAPSQIITYQSLSAYEVRGKMFIKLKYRPLKISD